MDKEKIKDLLGIGEKVSQVPEDEMLKLLRYEVTNVYIMNGVHRSMSKEAFEQEVVFCAQQLRNGLISDRLYSSIRSSEIAYIMSEGIKGRLGTDKDIVLTYKSIVRWIEAYVLHPIRREAVDAFYTELKKNRKQEQIPQSTMSDEKLKAMVKEAWDEYNEYRQKEPAPKLDAVKNISEIVGLPFICYDYGGRRLEYMRKNGYAADGESLVEVFERAYKNGGRFEKV